MALQPVNQTLIEYTYLWSTSAAHYASAMTQHLMMLYTHTCNLLHRLHNWVIYMTPSDVYKDKTLSRQHQSSPVWSRQSKTRKYRHLCCDIVQWFTIAYSIKWPWILCPLELKIMCLRVSSCLGWARPLCLNTSLMTPHSSLLFHVEEDLITFLE